MNHPALRTLYIILGSIALGLGILGIFLPLLPTTPFLLLAAFFFSRGSERLHQWLLRHPYLGPPIRNWSEHRVIAVRAKIFALATMVIGLASVWHFFPAHLPYGKYALMALMLAISVFIAAQRSTPVAPALSKALRDRGS